MKFQLARFQLSVRLNKLPVLTGVNVEILNQTEFDKNASDIRVIFHHGDATTGAEHIYRQWRDVFIGSNVPFVVMFRNRKIYKQVSQEFPNDPLVLVNGNEPVPDFIKKLPSLRAIMYSGNTGNIVHLLQFAKLRHCFIGHGDSDKNASATKVFRVYDEIWVAGQAHIDRLKSLGSSWRFRIVGRPQTKSLITSHTRKPKSICYLPTWEGPNEDNMYCSLGIIDQVLDCLKTASDEVTVKLHPCTGFRLKNVSAINSVIAQAGVSHTETSTAVLSVMEGSDICVTDTSSVVSDWLTSQRPIVVFVPASVDRTKLDFAKYCYVYSNAAELREVIDNLRSGNDPLMQCRSEAASYRVDLAATINNQFVTELREIAGFVN